MTALAKLTLTQKTSEGIIVHFEYAELAYDVFLKYKILHTDPQNCYWDLAISSHPLKGLVKYVLRLENGAWEKFIGINSLDSWEERILLFRLRELLAKEP